MTIAQPQLFPTSAHDDVARTQGADRPSSSFAQEAGQPVDDAEQILADLRIEFDRLSGQVTSAIKHQADAVSRGVRSGADYVAEEVRREPIISIGVATLCGILVGLAVTHAAVPRPTWQDTAKRYQDGMKHELETLLARTQAAARDAQSSTSGFMSSGFMPTVERFMQNLSQMDVGSSLAPTLEKSASVFKSIWNSMTAPRT